ncbi:MAG: aldehyde dehydrogenase family protein [Rhizobiaceae bacterium]
MNQHDRIASAFDVQKAAMPRRRVEFGLRERLAALDALKATIDRREKDILAALAADFGKPEAETTFSEIMPVMQEIAHVRGHLRSWMKPRRILPTMATFGTSAQIRPEARGVCLIIAPWNYPFNLMFSPLVSALAAGNSAILKPSEMTPATSRLIAEIVSETFPPDLVTVIEGDKDVSQRLLELPFDHIFFTGSPQVGKIVMAAAAKNLASVTLELGGKSPTIVGPGADLAKAAQWTAFGRFSNAGQTCIAPDHVYVHRSVAEEFKTALRQEISNFYGAAPEESPHLARIVNDHHAGRLRGLLEDALEKGAKLVHGGRSEGRFVEPTLIEALTPEMEIDREEIFGPILPIMTFTDIEEPVAHINERPKPLALYVFERDRSLIERVISSTSSGGVSVNATFLHYTHPGLPFGGVNNSGLGSAHGIHGFRAFSHEKSVLTNRFSAVPMLFPPYTERVKRLIRMARRLLG